MQILHYPLFRRIGHIEFTGYHRAYVSSVRYVVIPPMLIEFVTAFALPIMAPSLWTNFLYVTALLLLVLVWLSTFFLQAPLHGVLRREFEPHEHRLLVHTNWIRTIGWSLRGILLSLLFLQWLAPR